MQSALLSLHIIDVLQMTGLLRRTFFFNEQETKYVSVYLNENLKPQVKIGTSSGHVVLNDLQWFILVSFKSNISKNEVHELGDSRHALSMYCGRFIHITSENTHVYLSKKEWSQLMDLESACIDRCVIKFYRLQDELVVWRDKCVELKCFYTPPNTNAIDFDALWDELSYKNQSSQKLYISVDDLICTPILMYIFILITYIVCINKKLYFYFNILFVIIKLIFITDIVCINKNCI
jgi:hypothetical protein